MANVILFHYRTTHMALIRGVSFELITSQKPVHPHVELPCKCIDHC